MTRKRHGNSEKTDLEKFVEEVKDVVPKDCQATDYNNGSVARSKVGINLRSYQIAIGIPMDEVMFSKFFQNFFLIGAMPWDHILTTSSTYLPDARNFIHKTFLNDVGETEYLFMIDSDVMPPPDTIPRLLAHKLPLVGGWYRTKNKLNYPVVHDYVSTSANGFNNYMQRKEPGTGLESVDGAGSGCWMMRRDVAKALGEKPYDMNTGGEDLVMCKKVKDLGFDIFIDWSITCAHVGVSYV